MFLKNKPALLSDASVIRNESADRHNTAERVGVMLIDLINAIDFTFTTIQDYIAGLVEEATANLTGGNGGVDLSNYVTFPTLDKYATKTWVEAKGFLTAHQDISHLLPKATFNEAFEIVTNPNGTKYLRIKLNVLGDGRITAKNWAGGGSSSGGAGGSADRLVDLLDVAVKPLVKEGEALVYRNGVWTNEAIAQGLDESALATYLSGHGYLTSGALNNYALKSDIPSLASYATKDWVNAQGFLTGHQSLTNYYTKTEANAAFQPKGSYLTGHQDISHLLPKATFNEVFEIVTNLDGSKYLRLKLNMLGDGRITAKNWAGGGSSGGAGGSADRLADLLDVSLSALASGHALVYNAAQGKWVNQAISQGLDESALASYLSGHNYITSAALSGYLPLTGGKLTGNLSIVSGKSECGIRFGGSTASDDFVGRFGTYMSLYNHIGNAEIKLHDNKTVAITGAMTVGTDAFAAMHAYRSVANNGVAIKFSNADGVLGHIGVAGSTGDYPYDAIFQNKDGVGYRMLHTGNYTSILDDRYVTLNTAQEISGGKTFTALTNFNAKVRINGTAANHDAHPELMWHIPNVTWAKMKMDSAGDLHLLTGNDTNWTAYHGLKAGAFVKAGGTSSQFLKADGSVDDNVYLTGITKSQVEAVLTGGITSHYHTYIKGIDTSDITSFVDGYGFVYVRGQSTTAGIFPVSNNANGWITLQTHGGNYFHQLGFSSNGNLYHRHFNNDAINTTNGWNVLLTSANYTSVLDSRYVNAAGDTMTGELKISTYGLTLDLGAKNNSGIHIYTSDTTKPFYVNTNLLFVGNGDVGNGVSYRVGTVYANTINVTSTSLVSNLNADLLDGYHGSDYLRCFWTSIPGYDCNTYGQNSFVTFTYAKNAPAVGPVAHLGVGSYGFYLTTPYASDGALYYRRHGGDGDGGMGAWQQLARITDNVASATRLANTRTIWGQNFNGEGNVSGDMTGVGMVKMNSYLFMTRNSGTKGQYFVCGDNGDLVLYTHNAYTYTGKVAFFGYNGNVGFGTDSPAYKVDINGALRASGDIISNSANALRAANSKYGLILRHDEANSYFLLTNENDPYGTWNNLRPFYINNASGWVTMGNGASISKLNVGSPTSEKYALNTSTFICDSWVRSRGETGWYNETYGGGWYMEDSDYIKNWGSKRLKIGGINDHYAVWLTSGGFCCDGYIGTSWNNGYAALNVGIQNNSNQTPLLIAYRGGSSGSLSGANRLFALELLNTGGTLAFGFGGSHKFTMYSNGNFLANGKITGTNTSDIRLKDNIHRIVNAAKMLRSLGGYYTFDYKEGVVEEDRFGRVGLIYQNVKGHFADLMALRREDGTGALNYLCVDYLNLIGATALETEDRVTILERKVKKLENENIQLKQEINRLKLSA